MKILTLCSMVLLPMCAWAQPEIPFQGSFSLGAEAAPNTGGASFCGGSKTDELVIEAHGSGFSTLGAFIFTLNKTLSFATGTYHGCLVLTATNGDTLKANYILVQANSSTDFGSGSGTLTFTGGTGRFKNATGTAKMTAAFLSVYPASSFAGGGTGPLAVVANYVFDGSVSFIGPFDR